MLRHDSGPEQYSRCGAVIVGPTRLTARRREGDAVRLLHVLRDYRTHCLRSSGSPSSDDGIAAIATSRRHHRRAW